MHPLLLIAVFAVIAVVGVFLFPVGTVALLFCSVLVCAALVFVNKIEDRKFILNLFFAALLARILIAALIYTFELDHFFQEDALGYDKFGYELLQHLTGEARATDLTLDRAKENQFFYVVAFLYWVFGRNPLCTQFLNAVAGAVIVPIIYLCAYQIFSNVRVARRAAILVAFFPSLMLWTSQGIKDGLTLLFLAATILATLMLHKKITATYIVVLLIGLAGVFSFRFYAFFMLATAVVGSFLLGPNLSVRKLTQRACAVVLVAIVLSYVGILQRARSKIESFGSLEKIEASRQGMQGDANSTFGEDLKIDTVSGLLTALPIGLAYSMLAPFPWDMDNFRQILPLPELLIWWTSIPLLIGGLWYTLRNHFRKSLVIVLFTIVLTLSSAIIEGNVGTAYRHRTQVQIFYFIFVAVGVTLLQERSENKRLIQHRRKPVLKSMPNFH